MKIKKCVLVLFAAILCFLTSCDAASRKDCSLNVLRNPNEKHLPVLLHNYSSHFDLIVPEKGHIKLNCGDRITLLCPNQRNTLTATNSKSMSVTCCGGTNPKILDLNKLLCKSPVHGNIQETRTRCANGEGNIIHVGYQVTSNHFEKLINVCYNGEEGNTLYTEHIIRGEEIKYASKSSYRPSFSTVGLGPEIAANIAFKTAFQKSTFSTLLGSSSIAERYINPKSYLSRGHLSPDADFLFASSQFTTYFYINTSPQWQAINGGNWISLENSIRKAAEHYKNNFTIITGTHGILKLPNDDGKKIPLFLVSRNKLPVPKFIWKIMYSEESGRGIAFISLNNPFVDKINKDDMLCRNICEENGWNLNNWSNFEKGYIYCCEIGELAKKVESLPHLKVSGVLTRCS